MACISFQDLLDRLPQGGLLGEGSPTMAIADPPSVFVPPTLDILDEDPSPMVTLVSARGATGKSTLALQLSAAKQVPIWHLDADSGVSAHALSARLGSYLGPSDPVRTFTASPNGFIIVDALDEARMRVSGLSWEEFLQSLIEVAASGPRFVLLGRDRVLEDVWMALGDADVATNWLEISHFDPDQRVAYVDGRVRLKRPELDSVRSAYEPARDAVFKALAETVDSEHSDSFVGYAPVLDAVVALLDEGNLHSVQNDFESAGQDRRRVQVLAQVIHSLLERDQKKTAKAITDLGLDESQVFSPAEQMEWLTHALLGGRQPSLGWCEDTQRGDYLDRVQEFVRDHPFRSEDRWASPVFSAYVIAQRFDDPSIRLALRQVGEMTGLLLEFVALNDAEPVIDERQFAALHASLLAAGQRSVEAIVQIDSADREPDEVGGQLVLLEDGVDPRVIPVRVVLAQGGRLAITGPAACLSVDFPGQVTVRGDRGSITLGPDCFIRCLDLTLEAETVQVARRTATPGHGRHDDLSVLLEARREFRSEGRLTNSPPEASFELRVPPDHRLEYPWVNYRSDAEPLAPTPKDRAKRFLNMSMNLMRKHGHDGRAGTYDKKLEGRQSIKADEFTRVIRRLEAMDLVSWEGDIIFSEPAWEAMRFSGKALPGARTIDDCLDQWAPALAAIGEEIT